MLNINRTLHSIPVSSSILFDFTDYSSWHKNSRTVKGEGAHKKLCTHFYNSSQRPWRNIYEISQVFLPPFKNSLSVLISLLSPLGTEDLQILNMISPMITLTLAELYQWQQTWTHLSQCAIDFLDKCFSKFMSLRNWFHTCLSAKCWSLKATRWQIILIHECTCGEQARLVECHYWHIWTEHNWTYPTFSCPCIFRMKFHSFFQRSWFTRIVLLSRELLGFQDSLGNSMKICSLS